MNTCPTCNSAYDPAATGGICPHCALTHALGGPDGPGAIDDFEFIAELGRGAMGVVSLARQRSLDRLVALKVIAAGSHPAEWLEARLLREARTSAQLHHPHIVTVHEVGRGPTGAFLAMEYCEGGDLRTSLRQRPMAPRAAALLGAKLADAIAHAHGLGVLHRDLKPSNILLGAANEPKISDFGLTTYTGGGELTQAGEIAGSPSYLAPELLQAGTRPAPAGDIYGLGALLYECVTGRPPFTGDSTASVLAQLAQAEPAAPRVLNRDIPADLETIILKCLEKHPGARYASAAALRDDLHNFLAGREIAARPVSVPGRLWRWAKRNPALAGLALTLVLTLTGATGVLAVKNRELDLALGQAQAAGKRAELNLAQSLVAQARVLRDSGRAGQRYQALALLGRAAKINPGFEMRSEAAAALARPDLRVVSTLPAHAQNNIFDELDFSPGLEWWASGLPGGGLAIRRATDGAVVHPLPARSTGLPWFVRFSGDGRRVQALFNDERLHVWDIASETLLFSADSTPTQAPKAALHPSTDELAWVDGTGGLRLRQLKTGSERLVGAIGGNVRRLSFSPDGRSLALVTETGLEVWNLASSRLRWRWEAGLARLDPAWSDRGDCLAVSVLRPVNEIVVLDLETGLPRQHLQPDSGTVSLLAFFPQGRVLASIATSGVLTLWDWEQNERLVKAPAGRNALRIAPDGRSIGLAVSHEELGVMAVAENDVVRPWRRDRGSQLPTHMIAFSRDGLRAATVTRNEVRLWDAGRGQELAALPFTRTVEAGETVLVNFDPAGSGLLLTLGDGVVRRLEGLGDSATTTIREIGAPGKNEIRGFLHEGRDWWINAATTNRVEIWPEGDYRRARAATGPAVSGDEVWDATITSSDGCWVATSTMRPAEVRIWNAANATVVARLPVTRRVGGDFSPDGRWLVLGTDQDYTVYDTTTWRPAAQWPVRLADEYRGWASFSPDGRWLALQVGSQTIELRETTDFSAAINLELTSMQDRNEMAWSSDSKRLCVVCRGHSVYEWNLPALSRELGRLGLGDLGKP